jgi:hypothetical protein
MKYVLLIAIGLLAGCQSLTMAGSSAYTLRQTTDDAGRPGFELLVKSGKEIAQVKARLEKDGDKIIVDLEETGVAAFEGQRISADALKIASEQAAKAAVTAALAGAGAGIIPLVGNAISSGGLPAAAAGAGGALLLDRTLSKPAAATTPAGPTP